MGGKNFKKKAEGQRKGMSTHNQAEKLLCNRNREICFSLMLICPQEEKISHFRITEFVRRENCFL